MVKNISLYDVCLYNPFKQDDIDKLKDSYIEFTENDSPLDLDNIIRYIILIYDRKSPQQQLYPILEQRKLATAELVGFKKQPDGRFDKDVNDLLLCQYQKVNSMIIRYVTLFFDLEYTSYIAFLEMYNKELINSLSQNDSKEIKILQENLDKLRSKMTEARTKMFSGDNSASLEQTLYKNYTQKLPSRLRPEEFSMAIMEGNIDIKHPYKK